MPGSGFAPRRAYMLMADREKRPLGVDVEILHLTALNYRTGGDSKMNYTNETNSRATEEEKTELRAHLKDYVETITERSPKGGRFAYVCPLCNSGTGPKGTGAFMLDPSKDCTTWHCFSCDRGGDLFDLIGLMDGNGPRTDFPRVLGEAREMFGRGAFVAPRAVSERPRGIHAKPAEPERDYLAYLTECRAAIDGGMAYLQGRGFTAETVARFNLGHDAAQNAITIPVNNSRHAYTARCIAPDAPHRYLSHGRLDVFNVADLYKGEPCFVAEGQFDAMSVVQAGGRAVAIMGSNVNALYRQLEQRKPSATLIIAMDADEPGRKKAADMAARLDALKIPHVTATWTVEGKDANERLVSDREGFTGDVAANTSRALECAPGRLDNVADYLATAFAADVSRGMGDTTPTGFRGLDAKLSGGLHAGVCVLGAVPSLGKTSLAWQMADNIAAGGRPVVFYSLEMSRFEMVSKAISRHAVDVCGVDCAPTALDVRMGKQREIVGKAVATFAAGSAKRLSLIPGGLDMTVADICADVVKRAGDSSPVVFVDYLQILRSGDPRTDADDKRRTDEAMRQLKQLSASNGLTVFVVSSLNRMNYTEAVGFESFKESGGIEYTADTIFGLQLRALNDADYAAAKTLTEKRGIIEAAKQATPRRLRLLCLKNRSGLTGWKIDLDYFPRCDLFRESDGMATVAPQVVRY